MIFRIKHPQFAKQRLELIVDQDTVQLHLDGEALPVESHYQLENDQGTQCAIEIAVPRRGDPVLRIDGKVATLRRRLPTWAWGLGAWPMFSAVMWMCFGSIEFSLLVVLAVAGLINLATLVHRLPLWGRSLVGLAQPLLVAFCLDAAVNRHIALTILSENSALAAAPNVYIDNGSDKPYYVSIDGDQPVLCGAYCYIAKKIPEGIHYFSFTGENAPSSVFAWVGIKRLLINPDRQGQYVNTIGTYSAFGGGIKKEELRGQTVYKTDFGLEDSLPNQIYLLTTWFNRSGKTQKMKLQKNSRSLFLYTILHMLSSIRRSP